MKTPTLAFDMALRPWFTCTPVRFRGDESFFSRDSGLLCKGFQALGLPAKAIMPGPPMPEDCLEDLIRTPYENLENPAWWQSLQGEGVVLYAWGSSRYFPVARAIRRAGLKLVCNMDTSGTLGILGGPLEYWGAQWRILNGLGTSPSSLAQFLIKVFSSVSWTLIKHDVGRARHLRQANLIGAVSPIAADRLRRVCRWYGGGLASRVHLIPHPVAPYMNYSGQAKRPNVVVVGRWTRDAWRQKNPFLLLEAVRCFLKRLPQAKCIIIGPMEGGLREQMEVQAGSFPGRLVLTGRLSSREVATFFQEAQVSLCTSNHESFHIASAEALCCGCSVVAPDLPELPSLKWFVGEGAGRLVEKQAEAVAQGVLDELQLWQDGCRDPQATSHLWCDRLHADRVALRILQVLVAAGGKGSAKNP